METGGRRKVSLSCGSICWAEFAQFEANAYRYAVYFYLIGSFGGKRTERLFHDGVVKEFQGFAARAKRKLEAINAAAHLSDLSVPPSNRLEKLRGDLKDFHAIRVNDQWRVIFRWAENDAHHVSIVDYH